MNKIALGTAQFGFDYGVNNKRGKIPKSEAFSILEKAFSSGVDCLDTAPAYGDSEAILGEYLKKTKANFKIVSKLPKIDPSKILSAFSSSLSDLGLNTLYGYLFHDFQYYRNNPAAWDIFKSLKAEGKIEKIGFSLYYPDDLDVILDRRLGIDLVQVPYSIFDRRFEPFFPLLRDQGIEVHVRSVFLQGLLFKQPDELFKEFLKIRDKIRKINSIAASANLSKVSLCLNFAIINEFINKVIVGVDSLQDLNGIISSSADIGVVKKLLAELDDLQETDQNVILPMNWQAHRLTTAGV